MTIKPLADRVLIQPAPAEEKTVSGIIIPDTAKEKPLKGSVIAVGNGTKDEEMVLKTGDTVLYGKFFCAQFIVNIGIVLAVVVAHNIRVVALIHSQNPIFMKAFGTGKLRQFKRKPHLFTKDLNLNNSVNLYPV